MSRKRVKWAEQSGWLRLRIAHGIDKFILVVADVEDVLIADNERELLNLLKDNVRFYLSQEPKEEKQ